jgi:hypothetical protein
MVRTKAHHADDSLLGYAADHEAHGALAISQHLDTRNQPIYAWAGRSAGKLAGRPEAVMMCKSLLSQNPGWVRQ